MIATLNFPTLLKFPLGGAQEELKRVVKKMSPLAGANMATPLAVTQSVPASLLLDQVTGAAAAYSLRKLRNAYTGSAVRVRRSSDNSEQDIGFSGNDFDTATFSSFVGAGGNGGALSLTYTLTSSVDSSAIQGATVELYAEVGMVTLIDSQVTNALGQVTFENLFAGTYYLKRIKSGWSFGNPDTETVS